MSILTDTTDKLYPEPPATDIGLTPTGNNAVDTAAPPPAPVVHIIDGIYTCTIEFVPFVILRTVMVTDAEVARLQQMML